jgi:hypothetical protein
MAWLNLIGTNLKVAWGVLGDLRSNIVLTQSSAVSFDFTAGTVVEDKVETLNLQAVCVESKIQDSIFKDQLLIYLPNGEDIESFSHLQYKGKTWRVGPVVDHYPGFVILEVTRGGSNE